MKRITLVGVVILAVAGTLSVPVTAEAKTRHHRVTIAARHCAPKVLGDLVVYPAGCSKPIPAPGLPPKTI